MAAISAKWAIGNASITVVITSVRNLGAYFDSNLSMINQMQNANHVFYHLHNVWRIRKFLSYAVNNAKARVQSDANCLLHQFYLLRPHSWAFCGLRQLSSQHMPRKKLHRFFAQRWTERSCCSSSWAETRCCIMPIGFEESLIHQLYAMAKEMQMVGMDFFVIIVSPLISLS